MSEAASVLQPLPPPADAVEELATVRQGWRVFSVTGLGVLLCFLNSSTLQVALPTLAREFGASPTQASWVLLAYMLVNTVCILAFGRLSDLLGRRQLYLLGLIVFMAGCLGCALAPSTGLLIAARVLQGLGAAAIIANNAALLADAFPRHALTIALGYNTMISAVAQVSGPAVGGALISLVGWQAVFLFNLPFGIASLVLGMRILKPTPRQRSERFDAVGAGLSMLLLGSLVMALGAEGPWNSPRRLGAAAVALLTLPAFLLSQLQRNYPLVDLRLCCDRILASCLTSVALVTAAQAGTALVFALFLQAVQDQGAFGAGWRVMAQAAGMVTAAPIVPRLVRLFPAPLVGSGGAALMTASLLVLLLCLSSHLPDALLIAGLFAIGFGNACFMSTCTGIVMLRVQPERRGMANGLRSTLQNTGMLVGTAICSALAGQAGLSASDMAGAEMAPYGTALAVLACASGLATIVMAASWWRE